ncbi:hypothetical protein CU044_2579 [Streptomyces sp. L-9-10]|nr:hypothetical protein CU044_2579 [Streptomyces sp. L-9-10]
MLSYVEAAGTKVMVLEELGDEPGREAELLGCTVLKHKVSKAGWMSAERRERAMAMEWTYSHPAPQYRQDRLGQLMTWWVADYVARRHADVEWIRSTVRSPSLGKLARERDGWQKVREADDETFAWVHLIQREPRQLDALRTLVATPTGLFGDSTGARRV